MEIVDWIAGINSQTQRALNLLSKIDENQLNQNPSKGKWSIGQLLDHIMTTNRTYYTTFESISKGQYKNPKALGLKVIPKTFGKMVLRSITPETTRKTKTVSVFKPVSKVHDMTILDQFILEQEELIKRVKRIGELQLDDLWIKSPASGFIIYTVDEVLEMMLNHEKRHLGQAEEIFNNFNHEKS